MKRSPMKPGKPLQRRTPLRAKPPAKSEVRTTRCKATGCRARFVQLSMNHRACSVECARVVVAKDKAERARKEESERRAGLEKLKTISDLEGDCRKIVQKLARIRDRADGCISCHMGPNYSGQWHGSHYRAHGACSSLQFNLWNIHKACAQCNLFKGGNKEGFITGLLAKPGYGRARLDWLDSQPKSQRFERDYLLRFKAVMGKRLRRVERAAR